MPTERLAPPPWSFPTGQTRGLKAHADAHDCIMVRTQTDLPHTSVQREIRAQSRAPLGSSADRHRSDARALQKPLVVVHHPSACSGVKALPNTSAAERQAAKLC